MHYIITNPYKIYNDKTPTIYQGRSTQYSVMAYMEKELKK